MYLCKCGRTFADPIEMTECELAGHPDPQPRPEVDTSVESVLGALTDTALMDSVRVIIARDRVPFRALLAELIKRLEHFRVLALELQHGGRDEKSRHVETSAGSDFD